MTATPTATRPHKPLTVRQKEVMRAFVKLLTEQRCPPTLREVSRECGILTRHGSQGSLDSLVRKGWLTCVPKVARGYRLAEWLADLSTPELMLRIDDAPTAPTRGGRPWHD